MDSILGNYSVKELRQMIYATNIRQYSELKKADLIKLMLRPGNSNRFRGIVLKSQCVIGSIGVGVVTFD